MSHFRVIAKSVCCGLLIFLTSCGTGHDQDEKYVLICTNDKIPYWQAGSAGLFQAAQQLKVRSEFAGPDSYDPKAEQKALQEAVQGKATGILISVADPSLMKDDIDRAVAAGIPVITVDSDAPSSKRLFFIGTDNYHAGQIGGQRLAKELNGKGNVVVFTIPEQANLKERLRGYRDALEATPQIKITRVVDMKGDSRIAFDTATEILGQDKKERVDAFVCLEALAGKEVATVLSQHSVKDKVILAMDTDDDTLSWIQKGVIAATISQKPYTMAYFGVKVLDDLYHHKLSNLNADWAKDSFSPIPAFVDTGSSLVDKTNVDALIAASKTVTSGGGK
ncbi:MAG: substrate-binding domain-containing protein [Candidatus Angelobacter sp.]